MRYGNLKKITYRTMALLLAAAMLGANLTTLSYASEALETEETYCGQTAHTHEEGVCFTVEKTFICGMEEGELHAHGVDCFEEQQVLICGEEAVEVHAHEEACWEETETYACGLEEVAAHTHGDGCYTDNQKLTCELAECEAHAHGEACYAASRDLTCGLEETAGHAHTEDCVQTESSLCCEKEEITEGHVHGEACYEKRLVQSCGLATEEPHAHSESCYTETIHMTCEQEEHVHTDACYEKPLSEMILGCEEDHEHVRDCYVDPDLLPVTLELMEQTISDASNLVSVTGPLPADAALDVRPLEEPEVQALPIPKENQEIHLFAYDISILWGGAEYQPTESVTVTVPVADVTLSGTQTVKVWHAVMDDENPTYTVEEVTGVIYDAENDTVTFTADSFSVYMGMAVETAYRELTASASRLTAGYYRLLDDVELNASLVVPANVSVTIDLNGHVLSGPGAGSVIKKNGENAGLTLIDSHPEGGPHYFRKSDTGPWEWVKNAESAADGLEAIYGGIITGGRDQTAADSSSGGGAIKQGAVSTKMAVHMYGGTLVGNQSTRAGGAIYGGAVYMYGGRVVGNYANLFGAGLSLSGSLNLYGGVVEKNNTDSNSSYNSPTSTKYYDHANIVIGENTSFHMYGGQINGNLSTVTSTSANKKPLFKIYGGEVNGNFRLLNGLDAEMYGGQFNGSVYMRSGSWTMEEGDGRIQGGSREQGGAVYIEGGKFFMHGGTIENCSAAEGGAIYMASRKVKSSKGVESLVTGEAAISGGTIRDCSAESGGAITMNGGKLIMSGGTLTRNTATNSNGGAIYMGSEEISLNGVMTTSKGTVTISGGSLYENAATIGNGGAISVSGGDLKIIGGNITENTASNGFGGGAFIENGNVTMNGGRVDDNTARIGGGLYVSAVDQNVEVNLFSGSVSNNHASERGGAIAVVGSTSNSLDIDLTVGVEGIHEFEEDELQPFWHDQDGHPLAADVTENPTIHYCHTACPVINDNAVDLGGGGGAIYINGGTIATKTKLNIYCLDADRNKVAVEDGMSASRSDFMMVEGGKILISSAVKESDAEDDNFVNDELDNRQGSVDIRGSLHVTGGQVDLFGGMQNPAFLDRITIDVNTQEGDYFRDHRYVADKIRTITYFENFEGSGQYTLYHTTMDGDAMVHTIRPAMYTHPGYELQYWYTKPSIIDNDGKNFNPNDSYTFNGSTLPEGVDGRGNLTLYGIWKAQGYQVRFDANAPAGVQVSGSMANQAFDYLEDEPLTKNAYVSPNYYFAGWSRTKNADPTDPVQQQGFFADEAVIPAAEPLTTTDGSVVDLYAMWLPCAHDVTKDYAHYVYSVVGDSGNNSVTLRRSCSCGGVHWDRVLSASNATYNGSSHGAVLGTNAEWTSGTVTGPVYRSGSADLGTNAPVDAGTYTATVTLTDAVEPGGTTETITAMVTYTIAQAEQPAPASGPEIKKEVRGDGKTYVVVKTPAPDSEAQYGTATEYQLVYYKLEDGHLVKVEKGWRPVGYGGETYFAEEADVAMTNYYVEARYAGNTNYRPSEAVQSKMYVTYEGATVEFEVQTGIVCASSVAGAGQLNIVLQTESGYYLKNGPGSYGVTLTLKEGSGERPLDKTSGAEDEPATYLLSGIESGDHIVIEVSGVAKKAVITAQATERQVFGSMPIGADAEVTVSRDSAFTAHFSASGYQGVYSEFVLTFDQALPAGASIILVDKSGSQNTYWYYPGAAAGVAKNDAIRLTAFQNMATGSMYAPGEALEVRIVVDFSRTASGVGVNGLHAELTGKKTDEHAPDLAAAVSATLAEVRFESLMANSEGYGALQGNINYVVTKNGAASKWEDRHMALVLTPRGALPKDAWLEPVAEAYSARYDVNANGQFVVPVGAVQRGSVTLQLRSNLLPAEAAEYVFDVAWYVSDSLADAAPINGTRVDKEATLTLRKAADAVPAFRISGETVVNDGVLTVELEYQNVANATIEMVVEWRDEKGAYHSSAQRLPVTGSAEKKTEIRQIPLGVNDPGNYRVRVTVIRNNVLLLEPVHYFILEAHTASEAGPTG